MLGKLKLLFECSEKFQRHANQSGEEGDKSLAMLVLYTDSRGLVDLIGLSN